MTLPGRPELTAARWDAEYRTGRYADEPPLPFVWRIIDTLRDASIDTGIGLYVGCGNGRNYLPFVDAGLELVGLDVSPEAIRHLRQRRPALAAERLVCEDFLGYEARVPQFDYVVAIQVFQHGDDADVQRYFARVAALLRPGGLFFLRVNSAGTQIYHAHTIVERNPVGGVTIRYDDGPKRGLLVHFFTDVELRARLEPAFTVSTPPCEDVTVRPAPKTGSWAQWESTWKRRDADRPRTDRDLPDV
jgi:SAM-dependent methyltransferase